MFVVMHPVFNLINLTINSIEDGLIIFFRLPVDIIILPAIGQIVKRVASIHNQWVHCFQNLRVGQESIWIKECLIHHLWTDINELL